MAKKFTSEMVDMYADKLLIGLSREENEMVLEEMGEIDADLNKYINNLAGIETVEPMSWCLDREITTLRDDEIEESIPIEKALANSDRTTDREIEIPKVVSD